MVTMKVLENHPPSRIRVGIEGVLDDVSRPLMGCQIILANERGSMGWSYLFNHSHQLELDLAGAEYSSTATFRELVRLVAQWNFRHAKKVRLAGISPSLAQALHERHLWHLFAGDDPRQLGITPEGHAPFWPVIKKKGRANRLEMVAWPEAEALVILLVGELSRETVPSFADFPLSLICRLLSHPDGYKAGCPFRQIHLDLGSVAIDPYGITTLERMNANAQAAAVEVGILGLPPEARDSMFGGRFASLQQLLLRQ